FHRPHTTMGSYDLAQRAIKPRHRGRHLLRLALPQPRRALDVGQKQRHRSGRQLAHAQVPPAHRPHVRAAVSPAHASQRPAIPHDRTSAKTRIYTRWAAEIRPLTARIFALWPTFVGRSSAGSWFPPFPSSRGRHRARLRPKNLEQAMTEYATSGGTTAAPRLAGAVSGFAPWRRGMGSVADSAVRMTARSRSIQSLRRRGSESELRTASSAATESAGRGGGRRPVGGRLNRITLC